MTVTITITDPTADESRAVRAYLDALHAEAPDYSSDITPEGVQQMRDLAAPTIEGADLEQIDPPVTAEDAGAPDFDSAGLPWDERIHASSRATVADGTWRKKRGVSPEEVAAVELELRALTQYEPTEEELKDAAAARGEPYPVDPEQEKSVPDAPTVETHDLGHVPDNAPEVPEVPVGESVPTVTEVGTTETDTPASAGDADAPPPPPAATPNPFLAVMSRIGKSKLDKAKKDELLTAAGALDDKGNPSILVLNKKPELIDGFVALLDSEGV